MDSFGLGFGPMTGSCKHDNEPWIFVHDGEFRDQLNDCQLVKNNCITWNCGIVNAD